MNYDRILAKLAIKVNNIAINCMLRLFDRSIKSPFRVTPIDQLATLFLVFAACLSVVVLVDRLI